MVTVRRNEVCPACGQCLNSGVTQEGFDDLKARSEQVDRELELARNRWWFVPVGSLGVLLFIAAVTVLVEWEFW